MLLRLSDGSAIDERGTIVYFSLDRFKRQICEEGHCFLCGASAASKPFNCEHVVPRWLLSDLDLYNRRITLPNGATFPYGEYRIACCADCNSRLGVAIEGPVSEVMRGGMKALARHVEHEGSAAIYTWLSLIFLKTHLRDRLFRYQLDRRSESGPIAKEYDWGEFHHTHAVARAFFSGCTVEPEALGSFMVMQTKTAEHYESFDYHDLFLAQTAMIRMRDIGIVAVFDDGCAAWSDRAAHLSRIEGPLSPIQLREVFAHLAYSNLRLAKRPMFYTDFSTDPPRIRTFRTEYVEMQAHEPEVLGKMMYASLAPYLDRMRNRDIAEIREYVRQGKHTFLYDKQGKFIRNSLEPIVE